MSLLSIAAIAAAALIQTPSDEASMVIRSGDSEMSCDALAASINDLSAQVREQQQQSENARNAGRVGRGLLSGLARGASMFGYRSSEGAAAAVAVTAAASAADQMAASGNADGDVATVEQQRLAHLGSLHAARSC